MAWDPALAWAFQEELTAAKFAQMVENLRLHDHRFDGTRGVPMARFATGRETVLTVANSSTEFSVTFPAGRFDSDAGAPPIQLFVSPDVATGLGTNLLAWGGRTCDASGGLGYVHRTTAVSTPVDWVAVQRG